MGSPTRGEMTTGYEIYPSPTLQFVTLDLQYPLALGLQRQETREALYERLAEAYPLLQSVNTVEFQFAGAVGGAPPVAAPPTAAASIKMLNREKTRSVTLGATSLQVETSLYVGYDEFAASIRQVLQGVAEVASVPGINRIGLRYTDEIRIAGISKPADWAPYIDQRLLGPVRLAEREANATRCAIEFPLGEGRGLRMQYGAMPEGAQPAVDPAGPLRLRTTGSGPFFVIDMDAYWTAPETGIPRLIVDEVLDVCEDLHTPLHELFEASITERLREEVLRRPSE